VLYEKELHAARRAALKAGELALHHRSKGLTTEDKADFSPVTTADREAERLISSMLFEEFPNDGLLGEEGGDKPSGNGRRWIIDPIDGTRDYFRGNPAWAVMIALEETDGLACATVHMPDFAETYFAIRGKGAFRDGTRIQVSSISEVSRAVLCVNGFNYPDKLPCPDRFIEYIGRFWCVRAYGGCLDAMLVAQGRADAWIDVFGSPWDFAAPKLIIEEAGGVFFNFDGGNSIHGGNCVLATPGLADQLRRFVQCLPSSF
jgi:histidinol phosphatase-like enzyme (inositol monophosphatase family)